MTEAVKAPDGTEGTTTTETVVTPPVKPAVVTKPAAVAETPSTEPEFLKDRLDRERRSILKDLGIKLKRDEDPAERIEEYKTQLESDRTENKTLKKTVAAHEVTIGELAASKAAVKVFADTEFNALSEPQKAIVIASAGDDPNERLKTIAIMKAMTPSLATTTATTVAAVKPITVPANTAPGQTAPEVATSQVVDVKAEYSRLQQVNPLSAAAFLLQNQHAFYQQK